MRILYFLKFYISSFYFIFLLHLLFWSIDRFFFILTREITETVSNRIRYGPIKSFFSHFWFFISIFFLSFYSFFFLFVFIFCHFITRFTWNFIQNQFTFFNISIFFWNITIYYSIYFLKLKLFYLNILKMSCILFYLYIVRMKHLNHINRNIIRGKNMKFCFKKVKNKFYWYNIYT